MSRCSICDTLLSRYELAIRYNAGHELSDNFVDMCTYCLAAMSEEAPTITTDFSTVVISNYSSNTEGED
jgi:hypothetical protein